MFFAWSYAEFVDWLQGRHRGDGSEESAAEEGRRRPRPRPRSIPWRPVDGDDPGELFQTGWPDEVFVTQPVLRSVREHLPEIPGEQGYGFLLGRRLECPATGDPYLLIDDIWAATDPLRERYGAEPFGQVLATAREAATEAAKEVLGWFHTHSPLMGLGFSEHDVQLHARYFPEKWHCALVEVVHGEAPMGGIYQRRQKHRYPGTKLISFLEVTSDNGLGKWGEMKSQLDWANYTTPRANVRRVAPPRAPSRVIRTRGGIPGPERARPARVERRQPTAGPSWKWLPIGDQPETGTTGPPQERDRPTAAEAPPPRRAGPSAPSGAAPADAEPAEPAEAPSHWHWVTDPAPATPTPSTEPREPAGPRAAPGYVSPEEKGLWIASPLPAPVGDGSERATVAASAGTATEVEPPPPEPAEVVVSEPAPTSAPGRSAAPFTGIEDSPAGMAWATPPGHEPESPEPPEGEPVMTLERADEPFPFRLEPLESAVSAGSLRRAIDALRTVIASRRRTATETVEEAADEPRRGAAPEAEAAVESTIEAEPTGESGPEPERTVEPEPEGEPAADVEVPVVLPAEETWAERLVPLRAAARRQWKALAAIPVVLLLGFLILQAMAGDGLDRGAFESASAAPATAAELDRFERLRDALAMSLALHSERRADFQPGEAGCIGLSVAFASVSRDFEAMRSYMEVEGGDLPDRARDEWRRLSSATDGARSTFEEAGCQGP